MHKPRCTCAPPPGCNRTSRRCKRYPTLRNAQVLTDGVADLAQRGVVTCAGMAGWVGWRGQGSRRGGWEAGRGREAGDRGPAQNLAAATQAAAASSPAL